ncbi:MAG: hypothetical protein U0R17_05080 [Acidimicrobiia bacterium]
MLLLIILGTLWAAVLVPPLLRARSEKKSSATGDYANTLGVLESSNRNIRSMPRMASGLVDSRAHNSLNTKSKANKRRQDILKALLIAAVTTLLLAIFVSFAKSFWIALNVIIDIALGTYIYLLLQIKEQKTRRNQKF